LPAGDEIYEAGLTLLEVGTLSVEREQLLLQRVQRSLLLPLLLAMEPLLLRHLARTLH